jgi:hypothetical protein
MQFKGKKYNISVSAENKAWLFVIGLLTEQTLYYLL